MAARLSRGGGIFACLPPLDREKSARGARLAARGRFALLVRLPRLPLGDLLQEQAALADGKRTVAVSDLKVHNLLLVMRIELQRKLPGPRRASGRNKSAI